MIVIFFAALWFTLFRQLSGEWSLNDQYSYGWFVPFFAALLFWLRFEDANFTAGGRELFANRPREAGDSALVKAERFEDAPRAENSGSNNEERITNNPKARVIGIAIAFTALALLFPIRLFEIGNPDWRPLSWLHAFCVVTITLVFLWWIGGNAWLRHFSFPILFVLVAVPWVTPIEEPIIQGLMRSIAAVAAEIANLLGVPALVQGNLIRVPSGLVGVNEACSGVRSLQTSLMIGLLFGELKRLSILRRLALIAGAIAIALIANLSRAVIFVWIGASNGISAIDRWHNLAGYGIVGLVVVGAFALAHVLGRRRYPFSVNRYSEAATNNKERITNNETATCFVIPRTALVACVVWLVAVEIAAASWYRAHERELVNATRWGVAWPRSALNFRELKIDDQIRTVLRFDRGQAASWSLPAPNSADATSTKPPMACTAYFFQWNAGENSALLANLHRPDVCLPSVGWKQTADSGVKNYRVASDLALPFRHFEFGHGAGSQSRQIAHTFYCLWEDRVRASQPAQMAGAPSAWSRHERVRAVLDGRRHLGQQVLELIMQTRGDESEAQIDSTFAELLPSLVKVERRK